MGQENRLLQVEERLALVTFAEQDSADGRRAQALLALDDGHTQTEAAQIAGLTHGQIQYILRKFREQRLAAFPGLPAAEPEVIPVAEEPAEAPVGQDRLRDLLSELDHLLEDLKTAVPQATESPYSPLRLLRLVGDKVQSYTPDRQLSILQNFEGMTRDDLLDIETWKGLAYMITYSAQFQADQTREQLNEQMPEPLKPDNVLRFFRQNLDKVTPEIAKNLLTVFEGASKEDLLDPETWKGLAYMIGYSAQFQAAQTRERLNEQLPEPLKPDTILGFIKSSLDKVTPDIAKQVLATFEGATKEDLLDPDTWKGVWYMLNYSLQFQAEQLKQRLLGEEG